MPALVSEISKVKNPDGSIILDHFYDPERHGIKAPQELGEEMYKRLRQANYGRKIGKDGEEIDVKVAPYFYVPWGEWIAIDRDGVMKKISEEEAKPNAMSQEDLNAENSLKMKKLEDRYEALLAKVEGKKDTRRPEKLAKFIKAKKETPKLTAPADIQEFAGLSWMKKSSLIKKGLVDAFLPAISTGDPNEKIKELAVARFEELEKEPSNG